MTGADPPVDVQRLREEARGQEATAVVHPALVAQLPHGRVDHRIAGAPLAPRLDVPGRRSFGAPAVVAGAVVVRRGGRARGEDLVVEVAPGELPYERVGARATGSTRPMDEFDRRKRAEVQVRATAGTSRRRAGRRARPRSLRHHTAASAVSCLRPALSPPAARPGEVPETRARDGVPSVATPSGTRIARGAARPSRRRCSDQCRKYGVNTAKWSDDSGVTAPGATAVTTESWTTSLRPCPSRTFLSRSSRRCAYALTPPAMCTASAPVSAATPATASATSPDRTTRRPPHARSAASRSRQAVREERFPVGRRVTGGRDPRVPYEQRHHLMRRAERRP